MRSPFCPGPMPRREFLRVGTLALGGLTLSEVLAHRAAAGQTHCDTSVIVFWMWGGPSQLETFDMKPDAPSEYRGPLSPIHTNVPGIEICEYMPLLAQRADQFSLIRSLHHEMSAHNDGSIEVLTGKTPRVPDPTSQAHSEHPDFGMVASRLRGAGRRPAAVRRRAAGPVHDQSGVPWCGAPLFRHGRPVASRVFPPQPDG